MLLKFFSEIQNKNIFGSLFQSHTRWQYLQRI